MNIQRIYNWIFDYLPIYVGKERRVIILFCKVSYKMPKSRRINYHSVGRNFSAQGLRTFEREY